MSEITDLHEPLMRRLRELGVPFTRHRSDRAATAQTGDADFLIHWQGRCLHLEFKTDKGRLSAAQKRRHAELLAAGCRVHVVRSLAVAMELVSAWLGGPEAEKRAIPAGKLVVFGGAVFSEGPDGLTWVRHVTPADAGLPRLK